VASIAVAYSGGRDSHVLLTPFESTEENNLIFSCVLSY